MGIVTMRVDGGQSLPPLECGSPVRGSQICVIEGENWLDSANRFERFTLGWKARFKNRGEGQVDGTADVRVERYR